MIVVGGVGGVEPLLTVTVLEIRGSSVRLGFDAPDAVAVNRWEVWDRLHASLPLDRPEASGAAPPR